MPIVSHHTTVGQTTRQALVLSLVATLVIPGSLLADEPAPFRGTDIILQDNGTLQGTVVNEFGQPLSKAQLQLFHGDRQVASVISDEEGRFAIRSLRNGTHVIQVEGTAKIVRFWGPSAAPPAAVNSLTIQVQPDPLVRGQANTAPSLLTNPLFIAGVVGVTIGTIAIVEHQNDDNKSGGSNQPASP